MKKVTTILCAGLLSAVFATSGLAHYEDYKNNIKEGLVTMVKSPKPVYDSIKEETTAAKFKPFGVVGGMLKGTYLVIKELATGLGRILTFNFDENNLFANLFKK